MCEEQGGRKPSSALSIRKKSYHNILGNIKILDISFTVGRENPRESHSAQKQSTKTNC